MAGYLYLYYSVEVAADAPQVTPKCTMIGVRGAVVLVSVNRVESRSRRITQRGNPREKAFNGTPTATLLKNTHGRTPSLRFENRR